MYLGQSFVILLYFLIKDTFTTHIQRGTKGEIFFYMQVLREILNRVLDTISAQNNSYGAKVPL